MSPSMKMTQPWLETKNIVWKGTCHSWYTVFATHQWWLGHWNKRRNGWYWLRRYFYFFAGSLRKLVDVRFWWKWRKNRFSYFLYFPRSSKKDRNIWRLSFWSFVRSIGICQKYSLSLLLVHFYSTQYPSKTDIFSRGSLSRLALVLEHQPKNQPSKVTESNKFCWAGISPEK